MIADDALWLDILLDLKRQPVGIRFMFSENEYANCSSPEIINRIVYCTAVRNGSNGKSCKMKHEHFACLSAANALGITRPNDEFNSGRRFEQFKVYKSLDVCHSVANDMVYCKHECYGVEIKPLNGYKDYEPHVVIILTNPYNAMRIIQGNAYCYGQLKNVKVAGMQAVCQECTSYPYETAQLNISLLCSGTRCVAQWGKDELGIGIPFQLLADVIDGLKNTVNPMDKNLEKKIISEKLELHNLKGELNIVFNKNYYTGVYGSLKQKANKSTEQRN